MVILPSLVFNHGAGCVMLSSVDVDELRHALGGVVLEAAYLERTLRTAFSALVGSKYAAAVDGRLTAAALLAAFRACRQANKERNRVIHDTWATRPGTLMVTLHDEQRSHDVLVTAHTLAEVRELADQVADAADALRAAMTAAFGTGWALVEDQLRQELGHEVRVDPAG